MFVHARLRWPRPANRPVAHGVRCSRVSASLIAAITRGALYGITRVGSKIAPVARRNLTRGACGTCSAGPRTASAGSPSRRSPWRRSRSRSSGRAGSATTCSRPAGAPVPRPGGQVHGVAGASRTAHRVRSRPDRASSRGSPPPHVLNRLPGLGRASRRPTPGAGPHDRVGRWPHRHSPRRLELASQQDPRADRQRAVRASHRCGR